VVTAVDATDGWGGGGAQDFERICDASVVGHLWTIHDEF